MNKKEWNKKEINFVKKEFAKGHGRRSIAKLFKAKFGYVRSEDSIQHCIGSNCIDVDRELPKVLIFDLETKPLVAETWGIHEQNVTLDDIIEDWSIMSFSAKFIGEDKIHYMDQRNKSRSQLYNDKELVKKLRDLMDEADFLLGQNIAGFDIPKVFAKLAEYEIEPPSPFKIIDTVKMARKNHGFTSNKLAFLSEKLNKKFKKLDHGKFPGKKLWKECMKGNKVAWKAMEEYNKYDILSTEELFLKLAKYDKTENVNLAVKAYEAAVSKKGKKKSKR